MSLSAVITIALVALSKNMSRVFGSINKKGVFTLVFISILNAVILFAITFLTDDNFLLFWLYAMIFLLFGTINIFVTHHKFQAQPDEKKYAVALGEIFFTLSVALCVCIISSILQFYFKERDFMFYPILLSGLAYLVPLFFYYSFESAMDIPATEFPVWEYPEKRIDAPVEVPNEKMYVIGFDIPKSISEKKTSFRAKAPENIKLGELFYHFINEYNDEKNGAPIEYLNESKEPIVWWFRLKTKWYQFNKVLDPSQRIRDNFIRENSVIICEQLIQKPNHSTNTSDER